MMTKKKLWWIAGLYTFCALIWTVNFFLHWSQDGAIEFRTALFGVAAAYFIIAAAGSIIRLIRWYRDNREEK